jgi:hypothetical protein
MNLCTVGICSGISSMGGSRGRGEGRLSPELEGLESSSSSSR